MAATLTERVTQLEYHYESEWLATLADLRARVGVLENANAPKRHRAQRDGRCWQVRYWPDAAYSSRFSALTLRGLRRKIERYERKKQVVIEACRKA